MASSARIASAARRPLSLSTTSAFLRSPARRAAASLTSTAASSQVRGVHTSCTVSCCAQASTTRGRPGAGVGRTGPGGSSSSSYRAALQSVSGSAPMRTMATSCERMNTAPNSDQSKFQGYGTKSKDYVNKEAAKGTPKHASKPGAKDWSMESGASGALFPKPTSASEWQQFRLSPSDVQRYHRDGYISNVRVLSEEQCDRLLDDYSLFLDEENPHEGHGFFYEYHRNQSGDPNNVLLHTLGHWRITQLFHDLVYLPSIAVAASQLLDPENRDECTVRLWHDQLFGKPPNHGGVVAWHQDYSYWNRTMPMRHLTVHIALDDQTDEPDNGCLRFVPGSHRWHRNGNPLPITDATFGNMDSIKAALTAEELAQFRHVPGKMKKGEASFHHPLVVHGSFSNRTPSPRRACVVNYIGDGVISNTDDCLLAGTDPVPKGERVQGRFFPVVFDPAWAK
ncbi:uncharacterized protein LOC135809835 [Sycon ciliatum]|uniref:uncharacterized protein LOC135809835 n=1 Tax=Sycon ciliatum TaxID=27933 RepID=UPI0031F68561